MAFEIDGFAVFHSIGSHRTAFAGITADLVKAARTLVIKLIKETWTNNCYDFCRNASRRLGGCAKAIQLILRVS
jgi:hypothetical protein